MKWRKGWRILQELIRSLSLFFLCTHLSFITKYISFYLFILLSLSILHMFVHAGLGSWVARGGTAPLLKTALLGVHPLLPDFYSPLTFSFSQSKASSLSTGPGTKSSSPCAWAKLTRICMCATACVWKCVQVPCVLNDMLLLWLWKCLVLTQACSRALNCIIHTHI